MHVEVGPILIHVVSVHVEKMGGKILKELQDLFWVEAAKYHVLPLDASALTRFILPRPSIVAGRNEFTYTKPIVGVPLGTAPSVLNKSFTIAANVDVPDGGGGNGMLVTAGGPGGYMGVIYLLKRDK